MSSFQSLLTQHIASSFLKQENLSTYLGNHNWNVDLGKGTADFGKGRVFPLQVLGTESEITGTWLWGWANEGSAIPPGLLTSAANLQEVGERDGIAELSEPELQLDDIDGHAIAMVACGLCSADAYYRGPYEGGAMFFTISGTPLPKPPASPMKIVNVISQVISGFDIDHRVMVQSFLNQQGYTLDATPERIIATSPNGAEVTVSFDELGRISDLKTTVTAEDVPASIDETSPTAKKPWWRFGK